MNARRLLLTTALALLAGPGMARAQFRPTFATTCAPRVNCNPCGIGYYAGGIGLPCKPGCYPVGYYPTFLYYSPYYYGYAGYAGGFYGGSYIPGTGAAPQQPAPTVLLTENVADSRVCKFTVRVPEAAQLWFNGTQIFDTGSTRYFRTPDLDGQGKFNYTVVAEWYENGQQVRMQQKIHFQPGDRLTVDFSNLTTRSTESLSANRP